MSEELCSIGGHGHKAPRSASSTSQLQQEERPGEPYLSNGGSVPDRGPESSSEVAPSERQTPSAMT
eukprot:10422107-Lingulodinium_polyedra.AAC.1